MPDVPGRRAHRRSGFAPFVTIEIRRGAREGARAAQDRAFVKSLGRRCVMSSVASLRPTNEANARTAFDRLCDVVESQSHVTLIAAWDGEPAGFLLLRECYAVRDIESELRQTRDLSSARAKK